MINQSPPISPPTPELFNLTLNTYIYVLNSIGDKMPPCLTPFDTRKKQVHVVPHQYAIPDGYTKKLKF